MFRKKSPHDDILKQPSYFLMGNHGAGKIQLLKFEVNLSNCARVGCLESTHLHLPSSPPCGGRGDISLCHLGQKYKQTRMQKEGNCERKWKRKGTGKMERVTVKYTQVQIKANKGALE
jgi:hypothetical protein